MPIRWTKANRKKVIAIRHPHKSDPPIQFPDPQSGWDWIHARYTEMKERLSLSADEAFQPGLDALIARLSSPRRPTALTVEGELYAMTVLVNLHGTSNTNGETLHALMAHWSGADPTFPVQMGGGVAPFAFTAQYGGIPTMIRLEHLDPNPHGHKSIERTVGNTRYESHYFSALQSWLFRIPEADFQRARQAAAPLRAALRAADDSDYAAQEAATVWSCVFSRDQTWVTQDVQDVLSGKLRSFNGPWLLASLTDPDLALRFAREGGFGFIFPFIHFSYDIMENLGADALAVLEALHARASHLDSRQKRRFASALKLARTAHPD